MTTNCIDMLMQLTIPELLYGTYVRPAVDFARDYFQDMPVICLEIGVAYGDNTKRMAEKLNIDTFYLIDPYEDYSDFAWSIPIPDSFDFLPSLDLDKKIRLIPMQMTSSEAFNNLSNASIDFIYIDGNHVYEFIKEDLSYWDKVKKGGILSGHDIWIPDVKQAVTEFADENCLNLYTAFPDWWFVKT